MDYLLLTVILGATGYIIYKSVKHRKNGKSGCSGVCGNCKENCSGIYIKNDSK